MLIEHNDLDYGLINTAFNKLEEISKGWAKLEKVYRNIADEKYVESLKEANRSHVFVPIARDTVLI